MINNKHILYQNATLNFSYCIEILVKGYSYYQEKQFLNSIDIFINTYK